MLSRNVLSLTKPKGKIYKTKSLGHYIIKAHPYRHKQKKEHSQSTLEENTHTHTHTHTFKQQYTLKNKRTWENGRTYTRTHTSASTYQDTKPKQKHTNTGAVENTHIHTQVRIQSHTHKAHSQSEAVILRNSKNSRRSTHRESSMHVDTYTNCGMIV